ncbi:MULTISPECIES: hypothetical protein [Pseudomonas]|uniref:hypothetical protein n=1 Tax=Pseudomonas TaxID=286 RepID=UPI001AE9D707|nr:MULTISPECIES: hypothetical protein [unclassified Pseudomonas]MBP1086059.1 hypothetical protein [Pseudomonas sp. PvP007]MBP1192906.1 hypothetical protein [Pseudomonas sp. PvP100]
MGRKGQWWNTKARSISGQNESVNDKAKLGTNLIAPITPQIGSVYRYLDEEKHADDFARGEIYISTLEKCRQYEDPLQGDPHEGHDFYSTGPIITGDGDDPDLVSIAARIGINMPPGAKNITISSGSATMVLRHAYVLCTTIGFESDTLQNTFGKYCVKIDNVHEFFHAISLCLHARVGVLCGMHRAIIYKDRMTVGVEPTPGPVGFVKPPDKYATQREYRFLWSKEPADDAQPLVISCPGAARYVTRVK